MDFSLLIGALAVMALAFVLTKAKYRHVLKLDFPYPVEIQGRRLPAGGYNLTWEQRGDHWFVILARGSATIEFPAIASPSKAAIDKHRVSLIREPDGRMFALEVRVRPAQILRLPLIELKGQIV